MTKEEEACDYTRDTEKAFGHTHHSPLIKGGGIAGLMDRMLVALELIG